jgi:sortase A
MRTIEQFFWVLGIALLSIYLGVRIHSEFSSRVAIIAFQAANSSAAAPDVSASRQPVPGIDLSPWSEKRIAAFRQSLTQYFDPPKALLRISKAHIEAPVFEGTDDLTLNRGAGWIKGTAHVGTNGNVGIAGHRDGFFRGLKDLHTGDTVDLIMSDKTETFTIDKIQVVDPDDVSVLQPSPISSLTLVTCYPFYFVGSAPKRYIVHASLVGSEPSGARAGNQPSFTPNSDSHQERTE